MKITIKEMISVYLTEHSYDGLYYDDGADGCGCGLDDLMPCGDPLNCVAARKLYSVFAPAEEQDHD